jgi:hypothetical protein
LSWRGASWLSYLCDAARLLEADLGGQRTLQHLPRLRQLATIPEVVKIIFVNIITITTSTILNTTTITSINTIIIIIITIIIISWAVHLSPSCSAVVARSLSAWFSVSSRSTVPFISSTRP